MLLDFVETWMYFSQQLINTFRAIVKSTKYKSCVRLRGLNFNCVPDPSRLALSNTLSFRAPMLSDEGTTGSTFSSSIPYLSDRPLTFSEFCRI